MDHPIAPYARTAYAQGWAASGGPMTDRVKAGCVAAIAHATEHAEQPGILEVTLHLGHLEGIWARIYQRRDTLTAAHTRTVTAAWRTATTGLDVPRAIRSLRQNLGLTETATPEQIAAATTAALAAARALLAWLPATAAWQRLRAAMREAIHTGRAEGAADAIALAADQAGHIGIDFDIAFTHAYQALANLGTLWADADTWLARVLDRQADALGRALADLAAQGADYQDMLDAATALLDDAGNDAVAFIVDWALNTALSRGALDLYASEGVTQVSFMTAGDARVCPACEQAEASSPYSISDVPAPPLHPRCVIGSTRVAAPGDGVVPGDEPDGLPPHPTQRGVVLPREVRACATAAVTETGKDFGRSNIRAVTVRDYVGDVIVIRTSSSKELTATPNHPIATRRGWVAIADLAVGDHVLSSTRPEWESPADPDVNNIPPAVEDVAQSFPVPLRPVPTSAEDFHGDGAGSEVHVVRTDRLLVDHGAPGVAQHLAEPDLGSRSVAVASTLPLDTGGPSAQEIGGLRLAAHGIVGRGRETRALIGARSGHALVHGGAAPSDFDASVEQHPAYRSPADTEEFCERFLAFASDVAADEVVYVDRRVWSGHVYNLDTVAGWYVSNGILTHNCRCTVSAEWPLPASFDALIGA